MPKKNVVVVVDVNEKKEEDDDFGDMFYVQDMIEKRRMKREEKRGETLKTYVERTMTKNIRKSIRPPLIPKRTKKSSSKYAKYNPNPLGIEVSLPSCVTFASSRSPRSPPSSSSSPPLRSTTTATATTTTTSASASASSSSARSARSSSSSFSSSFSSASSASSASVARSLRLPPREEVPNDINGIIVEELSKLLKRYTIEKDKWRMMTYRRAIKAISSYPRPLTSGREARKIRGIGPRIADKIDEIIASGKLEKARELPSNMDHTEYVAREAFLKVWGAGPATVDEWIRMGFRTIADLKTPRAQQMMTNATRIGVRYYDDFLKRIPRYEVRDISERIENIVQNTVPITHFVVAGSYRRGYSDCGDIDILICVSDREKDSVLQRIMPLLKNDGIITDDLTPAWNEPGKSLRKYMGVARLTWGYPHRRIDIKVYSSSEWAAALLYFTGSNVFNEGMRTLAKNKGFHLNDTSLVKISPSPSGGTQTVTTIIPVSEEEDIFAALGVPYVPPEQREFFHFY